MQKIKDKLFLGFVKLVFAWTVFALSFQITMIVLNYTKPELATKIGNELTWALDGRFNK
jgi:predicted Abi (CAAX) family protease